MSAGKRSEAGRAKIGPGVPVVHPPPDIQLQQSPVPDHSSPPSSRTAHITPRPQPRTQVLIPPRGTSLPRRRAQQYALAKDDIQPPTGASIRDIESLKFRQYKYWDANFHSTWVRMCCQQSQRPGSSKTYLEGAALLKKLLHWETPQEIRAAWQEEPKLVHMRITAAWQEEPKMQCRVMWPSVMLACLKECPARAIELLHATVEPGVTPPYAVADVLGFIVRWMTIRQGEIDPALESQLPPLLLRILSCSPPQSFEFKQWIIHRVITSCHDTQTLATLYSELRRYGHFLSKWTRLHIASRLGKDLRYKSAAFRILDEIAEKREMDLNGPAFASVVTSLLTFPLAEEDDPRTSLRQPQRLRELEQLLFEGVHSWKDFSPNLITLTTLMQGFCHNKDYAGAWAVHDLMRNQGIEPNAYVYSILLSGSKWAGSFRSGDRVISDAPADVLRNPVILNDLLHFMLLSAERETRRRTPFVRVFPAMLLVYIRFFKLEPLQKLYPSDLTRWLTDENLGEEWDWMGKMAPIINKLPVLGPQERLDPKADTLRIMTLGYISSLTDPYGVIAFYSRFCSLLRAGDEHALALIKLGSRVHDLIIKALTRFEGMLRVAISILEDMLKDTAARKAASTTATDRITPIADQQPQQGMNADLPIHPEPRDTTWNIILDAFCRNPNENLKSQLERVLQMMQRHGVKANKITWTLLTFAYANWQNPALVAKTYSEMVGAGYDADEYVDRAFARLNNRTTAITMLERNPPQEAPPTLDDVMLREELLETRKMLEERRARRLARDSDAVAEAMEQLQMQQNQIEEQRERDAAEAGWGRWDHDGEEAELGSAMPQRWDEEVERERSGQLDEASTAVDELGPTLPGDTVDTERETRVRNDSTVRS